MTQNPKKTGLSSKTLRGGTIPGRYGSGKWIRTLFSNSHILIPLISGIMMVFTGLTLVCVTIFGLISPLWVSAFISLLGSICSMTGAFLIYHTIVSRGAYGSLLNQAIRRVIHSQN